jgi:methanogenic corrinoid protein MtbC1
VVATGADIPSLGVSRGQVEAVFLRVRQAYDEAVFDADRDRALRVAREAVAAGVPPESIVFEIVIPSLERMVPRLDGRLGGSLAQHFMTSQIAAAVTEEMAPLFARATPAGGRVVIGTPPRDFHSLGKRIVIGCLRAQMVEVTDLGLGVPPERFVDEAILTNANVIAISSMMVHTARSADGCLGVRRLLKERNLEKKVKIIVGGAPYRHDAQLYRAVDADAWAENGLEAGRVIAGLFSGESRP